LRYGVMRYVRYRLSSYAGSSRSDRIKYLEFFFDNYE